MNRALSAHTSPQLCVLDVSIIGLLCSVLEVVASKGEEWVDIGMVGANFYNNKGNELHIQVID
jgi:hypothetical protein